MLRKSHLLKKYLLSRRYTDQNLYDFYSVYPEVGGSIYAPYWVPFETVSSGTFLISGHMFFSQDKTDIAKDAFGFALSGLSSSYQVSGGWQFRVPQDCFVTFESNHIFEYGQDTRPIGGELPGGVPGEAIPDPILLSWWSTRTRDFGFGATDYEADIYRGNLLAVVDSPWDEDE